MADGRHSKKLTQWCTWGFHTRSADQYNGGIPTVSCNHLANASEAAPTTANGFVSVSTTSATNGFDFQHGDSYYCSIVTTPLNCTVVELAVWNKQTNGRTDCSLPQFLINLHTYLLTVLPNYPHYRRQGGAYRYRYRYLLTFLQLKNRITS